MKTFIVILSLCLVFLLILLSVDGLPGGDDGYRHVKFAQLYLHAWPHLQTVDWRLQNLWDKPVDVWLGFHLMLIPFVAFVPAPIIALKLFTVLLYGLILWFLFLILKDLKIAYINYWLVLFFLSNKIFLFRVGLGRPFLLSVVLYLLAILLVLKNKKISLAIISAIHALSYSVFFMIMLPVTFFLLMDRSKKNFLLFTYSILGTALGVVLNPYFPENLKFSLVQTFAPLFISGRTHLLIGNELYGLSGDVVLSMNMLLALWLLAMFIYIKKWGVTTIAENFFALSGVALLLASIKTMRFTDYFIPTALIFCAVILNPYLQKISWGEIRRNFKQKYLVYLPMLTWQIALVVILLYNPLAATRAMYDAPLQYQFFGASQYILDSPQKNSTVFNTQWDIYPQLFFWNSESQYVIGMDPTFLYYKDKEKYWLWRHIADDELLTCKEEYCSRHIRQAQTIAGALKSVFSASFLVLEKKRNPLVLEYLQRQKNFSLVYSDDRVALFKLRPD